MSLPPPPPPGSNPPPGPPPFPQPGPFQQPGQFPQPGPFQQPGQVPQGPYPANYPYNVPYSPNPIGQPWQQTTAGAARRVRRPLAVAALIAAVVVAVGSVLPWVRLSTDFGDASKDGLDADGKITIVLAIIIGALFVASIVKGQLWPAITGIPVFGIIAIVGAIDVADVNNQRDEFSGFEGFDYSVGVGLWLVLAAGIAGTILSIVALVSRPRQLV